jgi:hypothetical protein
MQRPISSPLAISTVLSIHAMACGPAGGPEQVGTSASAIINGIPSVESEDFAVRVQNSDYLCTGVVVDPLIVLTASHCVGNASFVSNSDIIDCQLGSDITESGVTVSVGANNSTITVYDVKSAYVDTGNLSCTHDVAALILTRPITTVTPRAILLDSLVAVGTPVIDYGWGEANRGHDAGEELEAGDLITPTQRLKASGTILANKSGTYGIDGATFMFPDDYWISDNIHDCAGDSGSPLLDDKGNLVGLATQIASKAGLTTSVCGTAELTFGPMPAANRVFIESVFQSIGKMPHRANQPPPADLGGHCVIDNQCNSNYCVMVGSQGFCSKPCTKNSDCGEADAGIPSLQCMAISPPTGDKDSSRSVCLAPISAPVGRGCSLVGPISGADATHGVELLGCAAALVALRGMRRKGRGSL